MPSPIKEFRGYTEKNTFKFINDKEEERFKKYLTCIKSKNNKRTELKLTVNRIRTGRTSGQLAEKSNQNGYYWGVLIQTLISTEPFIGHTPADMDYGLRCNHLRIGGTDAFPATKSFSDLSTGEFEDKIKEIQIWALTEYGIKIETVEEFYFGGEIIIK